MNWCVKKHIKVCTTLNNIELILIWASAITGCISIFNFTFLLGIPIGIRSSAIGLKFWAIAAGIKNYTSIIKKEKKHDKLVLLEKLNFNSMEVLISKALIDWNISQDEYVLINNVLK